MLRIENIYLLKLYDLLFFLLIGPLQTTVNDFWQMIIESRSSLIIMVTALLEKGRQKCYKYWPPLNETLEINDNIILKTVSEETETSNIIIYRQIELTCVCICFEYD